MGRTDTLSRWNDIDKVYKMFPWYNLDIKATTPYVVMLLEMGVDTHQLITHDENSQVYNWSKEHDGTLSNHCKLGILATKCRRKIKSKFSLRDGHTIPTKYS